MADALAGEVARLEKIVDPSQTVVAVTDFFNALDGPLEQLAHRRRQAISAMYDDLGSYARVAEATGLSKSRVAQLYRESLYRTG